MSKYKVNQEVLYKGEKVKICEVIKGSLTNKPNYQSGILFTGYKRRPCTYLLSNGKRVRGNKLSSFK